MTLLVVGIIPARMSSSRFPGKPLATIKGMPVVEHVYRRASMSACLNDLFVATPDDDIAEAVEAFGGKVLMTSPNHSRGTDRVAEASRKVKADVIVNIQGDEPLLHPDMVEQVVRPFQELSDIGCCNLVHPIVSESDLNDLDQVKVVTRLDGFCMYMSRSPIPTQAGVKDKILGLRQLGVVGFTPDYLRDFVSLSPTPLERSESIDMLRLLEHGRRFLVVLTQHRTHAVDRPEDLAIVEELLEIDAIFERYVSEPRGGL